MKARTYRKHVANRLKELEEAKAAPLAVAAPPSAGNQAAESPAAAPLAAAVSTAPAPAPLPAGASASAASVVAAIVAELPGLLAVAIVETSSGEALAAHSNAQGLDPATAASHNAQVIRQKEQALKVLQLNGERIEDILITLTSQLHLLMLSADGGRFLYLVVSARDSNLAVAREVLRAHIHQLA